MHSPQASIASPHQSQLTSDMRDIALTTTVTPHPDGQLQLSHIKYYIFMFGKRFQQQRFLDYFRFLNILLLFNSVYYIMVSYIQIFRFVLSCVFGNVLGKRVRGELRLDVGTLSN